MAFFYRKWFGLLVLAILLHLPAAATESKRPAAELLREQVLQQQWPKPLQWGTRVQGVGWRLDTDDKVVALTFDACGGTGGNGYDRELMEFLMARQIPATLFLNQRWMTANPAITRKLADQPHFLLANHGTTHRPLSLQGRRAWGIEGTSSVEEVVEEVMGNHQSLLSHTPKAATFFRSGTAYYDEVAVTIVNQLGYEAVGFDIIGDGGARYSAKQVRKAILQARPGSIVLLHMNQPSSQTAQGVMEAIPILQKKGFRFVTLEDYPLEHQ